MLNIKRIVVFPFMLFITLILTFLFIFASLFIGLIFGVPYTIIKLWQGGSIKEEAVSFFTVPFEIIADLWRIQK